MAAQSNLTLWRQIERTDPAQVKSITGKAYRGNSPKPHFLIFKATETFGPCGIGWGFDILEEKLLDGALLDGFHERIHMARVRVWYEWNGKRGQVEHVGQTLFCGRRKSDNPSKPGTPFTDEDAPKKSVTDALVKALSMIGFAGDIFMGRYDDSRYVANLKRELEEEAERTKPAELPGEEEMKERYILECIALIGKLPDGNAIKTWFSSSERREKDEDFGLNQADGDRIKDAVLARLQAVGRPSAAPSKANGHDASQNEARH